MEEAGLAVWPPDESADADAIEDAGEETGRDRGRGQGPGLSAAERALVERHAMEVATRHFQKNGWTVEDVPTAIVLRPSMPARGQDAVTCRGERSPAGLPLSSSPVTKSCRAGRSRSRDAGQRRLPLTTRAGSTAAIARGRSTGLAPATPANPARPLSKIGAEQSSAWSRKCAARICREPPGGGDPRAPMVTSLVTRPCPLPPDLCEHRHRPGRACHLRKRRNRIPQQPPD